MALSERDLRVIRRRHRRLLRYLLEFGFDPEDRAYGETALMYWEGASFIPMLIRAGWDIGAQDEFGRTALHHNSDTADWTILEQLLQYDHSQEELIRSFYYRFQHYSLGKFSYKIEQDRYLLTLIKRIGGITPQNCPMALYIAYAEGAFPYIPALLAAGFTIQTRDKAVDDGFRHHCVDRLYRIFLKGARRFPFVNHDDYPLYVENGTVHARPELYKKLWPHLPRKQKKKLHRRGFKLRTMNFVAKWTQTLAKLHKTIKP